MTQPSSHSAPHVIAIRGPIRRWIEPWYGAYAILGALASGFAALLIPLIIARVGGSATAIGAAVAAQKIGAVSAPIWGELADRTRAYRAIFFNGFLVIGLGFVGFSWLSGLSGLIGSAYLTAAGLLAPRVGMGVAALLALPAIVIGARELPVPGGPLHFPHLLTGEDVARLVRRGGPSAAALPMHRWRPKHLLQLATGEVGSRFGLFLFGWFTFSLAVSAFVSLYPVLMLKSFDIPFATAATLMSLATAVSIPPYKPAGRLAARYGAQTVLGVGYIGRLVPMAGMAAVAYFRPDFTFWGAIVLFALFKGIWPPLGVASNDLAASLAPFREGAAMGLFNADAAIAQHSARWRAALSLITSGTQQCHCSPRWHSWPS